MQYYNKLKFLLESHKISILSPIVGQFEEFEFKFEKSKKKKRKKEDSSFTCKFLKWWEAQSDFKKRQSAHFLGGWVIDVLILFIFIISFSLVMPIPTSDPLFICGHHSHPIKIPSSRFFLTLIANQFHPCFFHNEEKWKIGKNNIWYIYIYGDQR